MEPITTGLIGGGINLIGNLIGGLFAGPEQQKAMQAFQEAQNIIDAIGAPPDTAKEIILQKFSVAGLESPELEQAVDVGVSKLAQYQEDPKLKQASMKALERMQEQSEQGLTAQDRLAFRQLQQEQERAAQGKLAQIRQEAQMRGMGGAGAGLAAELSAAQAGSERGLTGAMQVGAQAQQARMAALQQAAGQAQSMRGADLATAQAIASASDPFARLKAEEAMSRQSRNIAAKNLAQQRNITRQQEIDVMNAAAANEEQRRQREAARADYQNTLAYGEARAGARTGMGNRYGQQAAGTAQSWGNIAKGASDIFGAAMAPGPAKYDSKDGKPLFDPQTGKPLGKRTT